MDDLLVAIGLAAVIEGVLYALAPGPMRRLLRRISAETEGTLRYGGLALAVGGVAMVWMIRR